MPQGWNTNNELIALAVQNPAFMSNLNEAGIVETSTDRVVQLAFPQKNWRLSRSAWLAFLWTYQGYRLTNPENLLTPTMLLTLCKQAKGPWYEHNQTIYTWDSELNMQLAMFDGSLLAFSRFLVPK